MAQRQIERQGRLARVAHLHVKCMERVEDFLQRYFQARTQVQRVLGELYEPLEARFFAPTYTFFDHKKSVADSEAERIVSVQTSGTSSEAITSGWLGADHRIRYHLSASTDSWRIASIEVECGVCRGTGKWKDKQENCRICRGRGWTLIGKTHGT